MIKCCISSLIIILSVSFHMHLSSEPFISEESREVVTRLLEGNRRYVNDLLEHPNHSQDRRQAIVSKQTPFAIILGCSDSRVSPEIIFDQGVGDLFVVRVAGNVVGPIELDSIEYAALLFEIDSDFCVGARELWGSRCGDSK